MSAFPKQDQNAVVNSFLNYNFFIKQLDSYDG